MHKNFFHSYISIKVFIALCALATTFLYVTNVFGNTEEILQDKIETSAAQIERLNAEIAQYQKELVQVSSQKNTLANEVKELDLTKKKLETNLKLTETKIRQAENEITALGGEIQDKEQTIDVRGELVAKSIKSIHESSDISFLEMLLSHKSFTEAWTSIDSIQMFKDALREDARELVQAKGVLVVRQSDVKVKREELLSLRSELADQKKILDVSVKQKNDLLLLTKNQESSYAKLVADRQALVNAYEAEMRAYEEQLQYVLNPNSIPAKGSVAFAWPLDYVLITQQFGRTVDSVLLYANGSHSGVDFRADVGTPVYAMASGTVAGYGDTDVACRGASFGKWVLIKYDNNLAATYGHLSLVKATSGQRVNKGDVVAYSGNSGHSTAPHLHVSVYPNDAVEVTSKESLACKGKFLIQPRAATTAYLNLLDYTPKTTRSMFK